MKDIDVTKGPWTEFTGFIIEREAIRRAKDVYGLVGPWTGDPVLQTGKFGNVWRRQDRGTRWELTALDRISHNMPDGSDESRIARLTLILTYRHNLIPATTELLIGGAWAWELEKAMHDKPIVSDVIKIWPHFSVQKCSPTIYSDADQSEWARYAWSHYLDVKRGVEDLYTEIARCDYDMYHLHKYIQWAFPRLGEFKAYEVLTSMTYLKEHGLDERWFVHVGHGALPMLRELTGDRSTPDALMGVYMPTLAQKIQNALIDDERFFTHWPTIDDKGVDPLMFTVRTLEDCLCEYRKYCAVKRGQRDNRPYPDNLRRWEDTNSEVTG